MTSFLVADETQWRPENVSATVQTGGAAGFLICYQRFLNEQPFAIHPPKTKEEQQKNIENHRKNAVIYAIFAEAAEELAKNAPLLASAPTTIKKDPREKIAHTWNLYRNIPLNAADLFQESLYLKYLSLKQTAAVEQERCGELNSYADLLADMPEKQASSALFQAVKRDAVLQLLNRVRRPLKDSQEKKTALPDEKISSQKLLIAVQTFVPFLQREPTERNIQFAGEFLDAVEQYQTAYSSLDSIAESVELLKKAFIVVKNEATDKVVREYAAVGEGTLRRFVLVGEQAPVWGADVEGNLFDAKTLDGKVTLIDFWATWCGPCVAEFPYLKRIYAKYHEKGFEIASISCDADKGQLRRFLAKNNLPWIVLSKESANAMGLESLTSYYGVKALPVVLLRDRDGKCISTNARGGKLDDILEKLFP
ncbi:MAG: TlpA family protein disulfide reductase [Planctomycetaceae bacterium]|nr:TlpA family protein disulfide reductase [Planctomycetaceae bacterium]